MRLLVLSQSASGALHDTYEKWAVMGGTAGLLVNMSNPLVKILVFNTMDWLIRLMNTAHN